MPEEPETRPQALARLLMELHWTRITLADITGYSRRTVHRWLEHNSTSAIPQHVLDALAFMSNLMKTAAPMFDSRQQKREAPAMLREEHSLRNAAAHKSIAEPAFAQVVADIGLMKLTPPPVIAPPPAKSTPPEVAGGTTNLRLLRSPSPPPIPQTTDPFMLGELEKENRRLAAERARSAGLPAPPPPTPLKPKES